MNNPIYFDYAATTPVDPRVAEKMQACLCLDGDFGNPASTTHCYGWKADELVQAARRQVASLVNCKPKEIIWTSGATESNNLAIIGAARFYQDKGCHIITCKTEHKAVLDTCKYLEKQNFTVTYLNPNSNGQIDLAELEAAITPETQLISIMHVNNELGAVQDIQAIGEIARKNKILFHVDAAQSAGKLSIDLSRLPVDLMSFSGHKIYGPKGIGALFVRRQQPRVHLEPLIYGGGHEQGMRSGTLATHQIVGMGEAFVIAKHEIDSGEITKLSEKRDRLWQGISKLPGVIWNGKNGEVSPNHLNLSVLGVEGEALLMALTGIAVSTGSACNSASIDSSHVLRAIGLSDEQAHSTLRISLGRFNNNEDIDYAIMHITQQVQRLREMSPLWTNKCDEKVG